MSFLRHHKHDIRQLHKEKWEVDEEVFGRATDGGIDVGVDVGVLGFREVWGEVGGVVIETGLGHGVDVGLETPVAMECPFGGWDTFPSGVCGQVRNMYRLKIVGAGDCTYIL